MASSGVGYATVVLGFFDLGLVRAQEGTSLSAVTHIGLALKAAFQNLYSLQRAIRKPRHTSLLHQH